MSTMSVTESAQQDRQGGQGRGTRHGRRTALRAAVAGVAAAGLLAVAIPGASAATSQLGPEWVAPGGEACVSAAATNHVEASEISNAPGLKFQLFAQSGLVIDHSTGPATYYDSITGVGYANWQGPGDYTACVKNNGTTRVYLQFVGITTS